MADPQAELQYTDLSVVLGGRLALSGVSLTLRPGEVLALIGPNGAGKSTLLRAGIGLIGPAGGQVRLGGKDPRQTPSLQRARMVAYLPQARPLAWPMRVRDVAALGRFAFGAEIGRLSAADQRAIDAALEACDLTALGARRTDALSGGELARVHVARALAGETALILADEPAAALDPRHAFEVMALLKAYAARGGAALVTLHDLGLAARFADRVAILDQGQLVALGEPRAVLTAQTIAAVFGVDAAISPEGDVILRGPIPAHAP